MRSQAFATFNLTAQEEAEMIRQAQGGDTAVRAAFIEANLRLVAHLAKHWRDQGLDYDELVSEGTLGMMHALDLFDLSANTRFSTYAGLWITKRIREAVEANRDAPLAYESRDLETYGHVLFAPRDGSDRVVSDAEAVVLLSLLTADERAVLSHRLGLGDHAPGTVRDAAKRLGIGRSTVSDIEHRAMRKLHAFGSTA